MPAAHDFDVLEVWCPASLQATRYGRADGIPLRVDRREPYAGGKAVVREVTQERRSRGHLPEAWQHVPDEMSRIAQGVPRCGVPNVTKWRTRRAPSSFWM